MKYYLFLLVVLQIAVSTANEKWQMVNLPSSEIQVKQKGFATYRTFVNIPEKWKDITVMLWIDETVEVDEGYFNGTRIGANGSIDFYSKPSSPIRRPYIIPEEIIKFDEYNMLAVRLFAKGKRPQIKGDITLIAGDEAIYLSGQWQLFEGDDVKWRKSYTKKDLQLYLNKATSPAGHKGIQSSKNSKLNETFEKSASIYRNNVHKNAQVIGNPKSPKEALNNLKVKNLEVSIAANEPDVSQPIQAKFDEKGRMWVVQYRQYPDPAGLKAVGMDKHLRKIFDRKLPPPPYNGSRFEGRDKISVHEDIDGDGFFEKSRTFVDGLNITTALEFDHEGIWVLSPPHLLFYKDSDKDGIADSNVPEVHLSGFNLEDTHSVANSLTLGPDGWLYGVTGSTTTGRVKVEHNSDHKIISFFGQTVWRYHREKKVFELFSEGGYNNFGLDFDEKGHLFSGTNKRTSILHFVQGGYFRKNLGKHGPHNNFFPYSLIDTVKDKSPLRTRLIHQWLPYLGASIPELRGKFIGPNSLSNLIDVFTVKGDGSSYECTFDYELITSTDKWFRPVHIVTGPDGAIYVSDWYDSRITHLDPRDNWDKKHGRIYRIQKKGSPKKVSVDLAAKSSSELIELLGHEDHWYRRSAMRLLAERMDFSVVDKLKSNLVGNINSLESLWVLYCLGQVDDELYKKCIIHSNNFIREWAVRLITDFKNNQISEGLFSEILKLANREKDFYVLSQLAASAKRMLPNQSLEVLGRLLQRNELESDERIPLQLWWGMERLITENPEYLKKLSSAKNFYESKILVTFLADYIGRRLISEPNESNTKVLFHLLSKSKGLFRNKLISGMDKGSKGRIYSFNESTVNKLNNLLGDKNESLKVRLLGDFYKSNLLKRLRTTKKISEKLDLVKSISYSSDPSFIKEVLNLIKLVSEKDRKELFSVLGSYESLDIAKKLLSFYSEFSAKSRYSTVQLLSSRSNWTALLLNHVLQGKVPKEDIKNETKLVIQNSTDETVKKLAKKLWSTVGGDIDKEVIRVTEILKSGKGDADKGAALFTAFCSTCHKLNGPGGFLGPDLSGYELHNLSFSIPAIVNPNLAIREGFELSQIQLKNGLILSGFIKEQTDSITKVLKLDGQLQVLSKGDIVKETRVEKSMMPEGITIALSDGQIRDLFEYLKSQSGNK